MIQDILNKWHLALRTQDTGLLDEMLDDQVIFYSPVVFSPQKGKQLTFMYLQAALEVLGGDKFKYTKEIVADHQMCLEFETKIGDIQINGVDIITIDDHGKIIEFKVMVRPLSGMMALKDKMIEMLNKIG